MKHRLLLSIVMTAVLATSAFAQDPGDAGLFWDEAGTVSNGLMPLFVPTNLYLIVFDAAGDVGGYEGSLTSSDPSLLLLSTTLEGPGPLNVGDPQNFIVGAGGCISSSGATKLITWQWGNFSGVPNVDSLFCLGASNPSSFAPAAPGYLDCLGGLNTFGVAQSGGGVYPDGCAVANGTDLENPVGTVDASFGAVKAQF